MSWTIKKIFTGVVFVGAFACSVSCGDSETDDMDETDISSEYGTASTDPPAVSTETASASVGTDSGVSKDTGTDTTGEVQDSENVDTSSSGQSDTASATDNDSDIDTSSDTSLPVGVFCPESTQLHTTSSGKVVCCSADHPVFCDENSNGYTGSCWSEGVNCDAIIHCGDAWRACLADALPWCDETENMICYPCAADSTVHYTTSGRPACCTDDRPVFCDENAEGYPGGCWSAGIDCSTIAMCNGFWGACPNGAIPTCEGTIIRCQ